MRAACSLVRPLTGVIVRTTRHLTLRPAAHLRRSFNIARVIQSKQIHDMVRFVRGGVVNANPLADQGHALKSS